MLLDKYGDEIQAVLSQYPPERKRSAVLPLLYIAQDEYGHLTEESMNEVAEILELPPTVVFEVAGFYSLLYEYNIGKWVLQVCDDVPCCFCGGEELVAELEQRLGITAGETTPDGTFTLQRVKCLAACDQAPLLQANLEYHYKVTPDKVDALLRQLRDRLDRGERLSVSGRFAEH